MSEYKEFVKADLSAIVKQLESCGYTCEGGSLEMNVAFIELKRIISDKHEIASCFAGVVDGFGITKCVEYIDSDDVGKPLPSGKIIRVVAEYVPESEAFDNSNAA